jgi:hypothetical protein
MDKVTLLKGSVILVFLLIIAALIYYIYLMATGPGTHMPDLPPAGTIFEEPLQQSCSLPAINRMINGVNYKITPVATYNITARVARSCQYHDEMAPLVPMDMVLLWGRLKDADVDSNIAYSQRDRRYDYRYSGYCPVSGSYIKTHSANTHIIPENDAVYVALKGAAQGQQLTMGGFLVDIYWSRGGGPHWWKTSRTRGDSGMGSCELFYVDCVTAGNSTVT